MIIFISFEFNKNSKKRFLKKTFLLTNVNSNVVLKINYLTINNVNINFQA